MKIALSGSIDNGCYYFREDGLTGYFFYELQQALESEENKKWINEHGGLPIRYLDKSALLENLYDEEDVLSDSNIIGYATVVNFKDMYVEVDQFDGNRLDDTIDKYKVGFIVVPNDKLDKLWVERPPFTGTVSHVSTVPSLQLVHYGN